MLLFMSILCIIMGFIYIFKKDWAWKIQKRQIIWGIKERPANWDYSSTFWGVVLIVIGVILVIT